MCWAKRGGEGGGEVTNGNGLEVKGSRLVKCGNVSFVLGSSVVLGNPGVQHGRPFSRALDLGLLDLKTKSDETKPRLAAALFEKQQVILLEV